MIPTISTLIRTSAKNSVDKDLDTPNALSGISSKAAFSLKASSPEPIEVGLQRVRVMAGSPPPHPPSHPPYVMGGSGVASDSGLDLPLEKDDLAASFSNDEGSISSSTDVAAGGTESPVNADGEVNNSV